jgi:formyltetrahydrofolate synthetase
MILHQVQPAHIGTIAEGLGLTPEEYDLYGTTQAKVCHIPGAAHASQTSW